MCHAGPAAQSRSRAVGSVTLITPHHGSARPSRSCRRVGGCGRPDPLRTAISESSGPYAPTVRPGSDVKISESLLGSVSSGTRRLRTSAPRLAQVISARSSLIRRQRNPSKRPCVGSRLRTKLCLLRGRPPCPRSARSNGRDSPAQPRACATWAVRVASESVWLRVSHSDSHPGDGAGRTRRPCPPSRGSAARGRAGFRARRRRFSCSSVAAHAGRGGPMQRGDDPSARRPGAEGRG